MSTIARAFIAFMISIVATACDGHNGSHKVTYYVTAHTRGPCRLTVLYRDAFGDVTVCVTDRSWSKEVELPHPAYASLMVVPQLPFVFDAGVHKLSVNYPETQVSGRIASGKKYSASKPGGIVLISLCP